MGVDGNEARRVAAAVAARFAIAEPASVEPFGGGHINDSWRVTGPDGRRWLLQRLNPRVFPDPGVVMENVARVTRHLGDSVRRDGMGDADRRALAMVPARSGRSWVQEGGACWRLFSFIEGSTSPAVVAGPEQAHAAARAFGEFQRRLVDLPAPPLHATITGFHDTPARLAALEAAASADCAGRVAGATAELASALSAERRGLAHALEDARRSGALRERVVHNDAKIANVLFDATTGEALCVVDLDTVMPGLAHYDYGDLIRSGAGTAAEDAPPEQVAVRPDLIEALAAGFIEGSGDTLSREERALMPVAARVITFEQAVRFLTDHLDGDRYYRVMRPGQNLDRCRAQLALLDALDRIV